MYEVFKQIVGTSHLPGRPFHIIYLGSRDQHAEGAPPSLTDLQFRDLRGSRLQRHLPRASAPRVGGVNVEVEAAAEAVVGGEPAERNRQKEEDVNRGSQEVTNEAFSEDRAFCSVKQ